MKNTEVAAVLQSSDLMNNIQSYLSWLHVESFISLPQIYFVWNSLKLYFLHFESIFPSSVVGILKPNRADAVPSLTIKLLYLYEIYRMFFNSVHFNSIIKNSLKFLHLCPTEGRQSNTWGCVNNEKNILNFGVNYSFKDTLE